MENVVELQKCRVCKGTKLATLFDLGNQFLTGRFPGRPDERVTAGPLLLVQCSPISGCGLVQLGHSYDLGEMYGPNYGYRSGLNRAMVEHLQRKVTQILSVVTLNEGALLVDVGSNDGTTLNSYPPGKYRLVGVDPAAEKYKKFYRGDIERIPEFFSAALVEKHFSAQKATVITSFSMFYDLEDPVQFAQAIERMLSDEGIWVLEQSYLPAMLKANSFDTICHEHLEYYSLKSIQIILQKAKLRIVDFEFNDINGGSFSIIACKQNAMLRSNDKKLESTLRDELSLGLEDGSAFREFHTRVNEQKSALLSFLFEKKAKGKRVSGLGASTKGNVLLQYYGITTELIDEIGEVNSDKFGCFTPGTLIPIVPQSDVLAARPDYLLVLPWHFRKFFLSLPELQSTDLVFPLPQFEVVSR